jgi:hypothetical protein
MPEPATLTVLGWSGCPTTATVDAWVRRVCADAGIPAPEVELRYVETDDEARAIGFIGSPTFLRDGADLFPEPHAAPSLTCRLYRLPDGRPSPLPDAMEFAAALRSA